MNRLLRWMLLSLTLSGCAASGGGDMPAARATPEPGSVHVHADGTVVTLFGGH